ncbi:MAG: hypothetical protein FJ387_08285 [Verrucomicrobia bacterium]|nr:hypothetical protein [Verrucomicrobiota bacterium]
MQWNPRAAQYRLDRARETAQGQSRMHPTLPLLLRSRGGPSSAVAVSVGLRLALAFGLLASQLGLARAAATAETEAARQEAVEIRSQLAGPRGWCAVLGDPTGMLAVELARSSELRLYIQTPESSQAERCLRAAEEAGLLGGRVFVHVGPWERLHLADNLMDAVVVRGDAAAVPPAERLRVVRPGGQVLSAGAPVVKPVPSGTDDWSHPYHGPDNNPQSRDTVARAPYLTHFIAEPWYSPMPLMTVAAGGRLFKAFGHIAVKEREWPWLNSLVAQDAFNGTVLWQRPLQEGFMVHRNTLIATPETLFVADDRSCRLLDPATGEVKDQIRVPDRLEAGSSWKWMALVDDTLYALIGPAEDPDPTVKGTRQARGWPWGGDALGRGYNSKTYPWGFGQTLLALDPATHQVRWSRREAAPLDARGMCLAAGRLFFYSQRRYVGALDSRTGSPLWKTTAAEVLAAIGEDKFAQNPNEGFSSSSFVKANDQALLFAGPTRHHLVALSAVDGRLLWQATGRGNSQLVLRPEGLYAMGTRESVLYEVQSGRVLRTLGPRVNCTRATGSADSIFVRGGRDGTLRYDLGSHQAEHLSPMRPSCQDGVVVSYGHLYWGPWMCDCNLTLIGVVALAPAGNDDLQAPARETGRLAREPDGAEVEPWPLETADWPAFRANPQRTAFSSAQVSAAPQLLWTDSPLNRLPATAPIAARDLVFRGGADGVVRALVAATGQPRWTARTGGAITYPPEVADGRLFVGSSDGWLYALEARTGRTVWRFRAAPRERLIPVYGALQSTWPVASGVLVDGGVVYAAAGLANYDGTHLYALDAANGQVRWHNGTSGWLGPAGTAGVSVNGHLLLHQGHLYLAGGNTVPAARYDLGNGRCVSDPNAPPSHTQFRAGSDLFLAGDQVVSAGFPLYASPSDYRLAGPVVLPTPAGRIVATLGPHDSRISLIPPQGPVERAKPLWSQRSVSRLYALAMTPKALVIAGAHDPAQTDQPATASLIALESTQGNVLWSRPLPAEPVPWGVAIDRAGRILVALQDGRLLAFGEPAEPR